MDKPLVARIGFGKKAKPHDFWGIADDVAPADFPEQGSVLPPTEPPTEAGLATATAAVGCRVQWKMALTRGGVEQPPTEPPTLFGLADCPALTAGWLNVKDDPRGTLVFAKPRAFPCGAIPRKGDGLRWPAGKAWGGAEGGGVVSWVIDGEDRCDGTRLIIVGVDWIDDERPDWEDW